MKVDFLHAYIPLNDEEKRAVYTRVMPQLIALLEQSGVPVTHRWDIDEASGKNVLVLSIKQRQTAGSSE